MKGILTTLCALALVITGCAPAAEDASKPCYTPISVEEYPYGSFDEPRINMTYQLLPSDNPRLIPTEDFIRYGRRYFLLNFCRNDDTDEGHTSEAGVVTYTVIFGSKKLPYGVTTLGRTREEAYSDPAGLASMLIIAVFMLALGAAAMIESRKQSHNTVGSDDEDEA